MLDSLMATKGLAEQSDPTALNIRSRGADVLRQWTTNPTNVVVLAAAAAVSGQLATGLYRMTTDVDCWFIQGGAAATATLNAHPLWAGTYEWVFVDDIVNNGFISVITAGPAGMLSLSRVGT